MSEYLGAENVCESGTGCEECSQRVAIFFLTWFFFCKCELMGSHHVCEWLTVRELCLQA